MALAEGRGGEDHSPCGGDATGANAPDRGTQGTTRRVLTAGQGLPLAVVGAGAQRHDRKRLAPTWDAAVLERPAPTAEAPQPWGAAKGDDDPEGRADAARLDAVAHLRTRGAARQARQTMPGDRARRWGVGVGHSW